MPVPLRATVHVPANAPPTDPKLVAADDARRGVLGIVTLAVLLAGGWGVWRWQGVAPRTLQDLARPDRTAGRADLLQAS
jgi:hypothetical protein